MIIYKFLLYTYIIVHCQLSSYMHLLLSMLSRMLCTVQEYYSFYISNVIAFRINSTRSLPVCNLKELFAGHHENISLNNSFSGSTHGHMHVHIIMIMILDSKRAMCIFRLYFWFYELCRIIYSGLCLSLVSLYNNKTYKQGNLQLSG